jgi:hypothetical protein
MAIAAETRRAGALDAGHSGIHTCAAGPSPIIGTQNPVLAGARSSSG